MTISTALTITPAKIKSRQIRDADVPQVVDLLTRGFAADRAREFWENIFDCLRKRSAPAEFPRYGFLIESDDKIVGVLLMIFSTIWDGETPKTRCNVSSWYVEKEFRGYAQTLVSQVLKYKKVTVFNVSASRHTYAMAEIRGFKRSSDGMFVSIPVLSRAPVAGPVRVLDAHILPDVPFDPHDRALLIDHAEYGCTSLWCVTRERAYPFVFRPRYLKKFVPAAQLVYCRNLDQFVRFARPIGLHLARNRQFLVMLDSGGPVSGLIGKYFPERSPKFFHGPDQPRLGDLAYTEASMFGV